MEHALASLGISYDVSVTTTPRVLELNLRFTGLPLPFRRPGDGRSGLFCHECRVSRSRRLRLDGTKHSMVRHRRIIVSGKVLSQPTRWPMAVEIGSGNFTRSNAASLLSLIMVTRVTAIA